MIQLFFERIALLSKELAVLVAAALPISELRGAIPLAMFKMGFSPLKSYIISVLGNFLPVIPLLFFLQPISDFLRRLPVFERFFNWLFERTKKKASLVEKFEALGLILFVAIPLPITGAWTGCVAATLFKIKFRYAVLAIFTGIILAGIIVSGLCVAGKGVIPK